MSKKIQRISRQHIDVIRWNQAVNEERHPSPYGLCWWLDAVTNDAWDGLVLGDYQLVLPLPFFLKAGPLAMINGAPFTQHLGPFGQGSEREKQKLLGQVSSLFYVRKLPLRSEVAASRFKITPRNNFELELLTGYNNIASGYRADLRRKLRRSSLPPSRQIPHATFAEFYLNTMGTKLDMSAKNQQVVKMLLTADEKYGQGKCYALHNKEDHQVIAALFLARNGSRVINLMAASTKEGYKRNAMAVLIDSIIREYAGQDMLFDFEGSDLPGVATFFSGYGATKVSYYQYQDKRLVPINFP